MSCGRGGRDAACEKKRGQEGGRGHGSPASREEHTVGERAVGGPRLLQAPMPAPGRWSNRTSGQTGCGPGPASPPPASIPAPAPVRARVRQSGTTGLYMASQYGHAEAVRLLLDRRADANKAGAVRPADTRRSPAPRARAAPSESHPRAAVAPGTRAPRAPLHPPFPCRRPFASHHRELGCRPAPPRLEPARLNIPDDSDGSAVPYRPHGSEGRLSAASMPAASLQPARPARPHPPARPPHPAFAPSPPPRARPTAPPAPQPPRPRSPRSPARAGCRAAANRCRPSGSPAVRPAGGCPPARPGSRPSAHAAVGCMGNRGPPPATRRGGA